MRSLLLPAFPLLASAVDPAGALPTMEQTTTPAAVKHDAPACLANPDRNCVAEIVFDMELSDRNGPSVEMSAERLAI